MSAPAAEQADAVAPILVMTGTVVALAVAINLGFAERTDYAGHFLAGAGGTALLLALVVAFAPDPRPYLVLATCLLAIGLGAIVEATVFREAAFDWVDICFQSSGAVLVAFAFLDGGGGRRSDVAFAAGAVLLFGGFIRAFS